MNRKLVAVVAGLVVVTLLLLLVWAGRKGRSSAAQRTEPFWKLVVTLPKTNSAPSQSNAVPKGN